MRFRVVIGGLRSYENYKEFCNYVDFCLSEISTKGEIIIISGHCSGTDMMAEQYAKEKNYILEIYPAEWKKYGRAAGPIRNRQMVENADYVIAFWNNKSRGTKNLIECARNRNIPIKVKIL